MITDPAAPTAQLEHFIKDYDKDNNIWWYLSSGHHQNLFEMAVDRYWTEP